MENVTEMSELSVDAKANIEAPVARVAVAAAVVEVLLEEKLSILIPELTIPATLSTIDLINAL